MSQDLTGPTNLWIVRHAESVGNIAALQAMAAGLPQMTLPAHELDVELSSLGRRQAAALGQWFAAIPPAEAPTAILSSPYLRTRQTADLIKRSAGLTARISIDERLREKELGILNRLTAIGIAQRYPEQVELRQQYGKFYYRPPGGESWCDVLLRLRGVLETLRRDYHDQRVLLVCHSVLILLCRYLIEGLTDEQILAIDRDVDIANCSVTSYGFDRAPNGAVPTLDLFNYVAPLQDAGEKVTEEKDATGAAGE